MKSLAAVLALSFTLASPLHAAELTRLVRAKISAGDLLSAVAAADDYKNATGVDAEYLDSVGWIARGAEMLRRTDLAWHCVEELKRAIPTEAPTTLIPYGAAIEVEGRLIAAADGRGAGIRYFEEALANAHAVSLRSRIEKNINLLSLEGAAAPPVAGQAFDGKPTLLFFWAAGCGDCKGQAAALQRVWSKYHSRGLQAVAVTRLYGGGQDQPVSEADERAEIEKFWRDTFPALASVPVVIDTPTMVRYGVSATPTFALVDRRGVVRLYTPTRLSEAELTRRIESLLAGG